MVVLTNEEKRALCQTMAQHLSDIRRLLHLSQARFGELAGISRARIIQVESGSARLSWGQLTSVLFLCITNRPAKEYLYANHVLGPRLVQYLQMKDANIPPDTNLCVHEDINRSLREQMTRSLPSTSHGTVVFTREERRAFADHILGYLPDLRRVMRMSQARLSELAGISRARLIQLEKKKVRLSWSQMTSILCVCLANIRAKEYLYVNGVLPVRFLQYVQQKEDNIPPDTNICVPRELIMSYTEMLEYYKQNNIPLC